MRVLSRLGRISQIHYFSLSSTHLVLVSLSSTSTITSAARTQCSQPSGPSIGPGGETAKRPGRDSTTECRLASSLNFQDSRHQCSQASSPSVFRLGLDGRQIGDLCPGRTPGWQSVLIYAQDGRPGTIGVLVYVSFLNLMSIRSVLWRSEDFFYSNIEKIRLYYHVSNFAINQPTLPVISDPGLYLCIFCSLRLQCRATGEPMGDGLRHMDDNRAPKVVILTHDGQALPEITIYKKTAGPARQPTGLQCLIKTDAMLGCPYPPCPGRKGL